METETIKQLSIHELIANPNFDNLEKDYRAGSNSEITKTALWNKKEYLALDEEGEDLNSEFAKHFTFAIFAGELIQGFVVSCVSYYGHADEAILGIDSLYLDPKYRHNGNGDKLLQAVFDKAKEKGFKRVFFSAPYNSRLAKVFARKYTATDVMFQKEV